MILYRRQINEGYEDIYYKKKRQEIFEKETKSNNIGKYSDYSSYDFSYQLSMVILTICVKQ